MASLIPGRPGVPEQAERDKITVDQFSLERNEGVLNSAHAVGYRRAEENLPEHLRILKNVCAPTGRAQCVGQKSQRGGANVYPAPVPARDSQTDEISETQNSAHRMRQTRAYNQRLACQKRPYKVLFTEPKETRYSRQTKCPANHIRAAVGARPQD